MRSTPGISMPIINSIAAMHDEVAQWRRDIHEHPEILYEVHRTAGIVAEKLKAFGCDEVVGGIGRTGVVGVIRGSKGASGKVMVDDGLMERWGIQEVYGMHNMPGIPTGTFAIRPGPLLAASDGIHIEITGKGGHASRPHQCIDPVLVGSHIVTQLHSIVSRNLDPLLSGVISICMFHSGEALNVIPQTA